ncbi:MAG TPA: SpoIIE family protein phosphatase [Patescibacteria group bacterium]|nr:SpoIIE family protein phosphatase [Patescibacteria group bacterium]
MLWNDWNMLLDLMEKSCVMAVFAYGLLRSPFFCQLMEQKQQWRQQLVFGFVFSIFSAYGIYNGLMVNGLLVALSRPGPILAGLMAGPVLGTSVGFITAVIRYSYGGENALAAGSTSLIAGILAGLYSWWRKGPVLSVREAVLFTVGFELLARVVPVLLIADRMQLVKIQLLVILPMVLGNGMMVAFFVLVLNTLRAEQKIRSQQARLEGELSLAREIQQSMVPALPTGCIYSTSFSLHAILEPAREVGGDLYDFFFLDEHRFGFVIADVSGKGIAAALFMSATRTLFKSQADREAQTGEIVRRVNEELCRGNNASMFVTLFCGILDIRTGEVTYSNAGHNPPYLLCQDDKALLLADRHGPALGVVEGMCFSSGKLRMAAGDVLLMYTDGVTEAMNGQMELFGDQRLEAALLGSDSNEPCQLLPLVMDHLQNFTAGAEQSDDITMLALRFDRLAALG